MATSTAGPGERERAGEARDHAPAPAKWAVLAVVALGVFMATLDSSIVNISLPAIAALFRVPLGGAIAWIVIAYLVVVAALLLSAGRVADMVGDKIVWLAGLVVFTLGSALCGLAPSLALLVAARALQGVGAAMLMAISPAMLTTAFPPEERGRALGMNAIFVALGVSAGPTLGGVLTERLSWRWIFFVNVPVGVVAVLATLRVLRADRPRGARGRFDAAGAALLGLGLAAATFGLAFGNELGWTSPIVIGALVLGAGLLAALGPVERRRRDAVLDVSFFRDRVFVSSTVALVLSFLGIFAVGFLMPFYLEQLRGFSTEKAGLTLTAFPVTIAVVAPISGALADRIGSRAPCVAGMAVAAIGLVLIAGLGARSSVLHVVLALVVTSAGQAMFQPANNSALMGTAPPGRQGVVSGILATARVVGQSSSVAVAGAIFGSLGAAQAGRALSAGAPFDAQAPIFLYGFRVAILTCAGVTAVAALASLFRRGERHGRHARGAPGHEPRAAPGPPALTEDLPAST